MKHPKLGGLIALIGGFALLEITTVVYFRFREAIASQEVSIRAYEAGRSSAELDFRNGTFRIYAADSDFNSIFKDAGRHDGTFEIWNYPFPKKPGNDFLDVTNAELSDVSSQAYIDAYNDRMRGLADGTQK